MIGTGLALRTGGHVGLAFFVRRLPDRIRQVVAFSVQLILLAFFALMLFSSWEAFRSSTAQLDAALQASMGWAMVSYPIGFALLAYHQFTMLFAQLGRSGRSL